MLLFSWWSRLNSVLVLKVAHDESGHFGVKKTYLNILKHFFWPRVKKDVAAYIKICHVCQLTGKPNQSVNPAPLQPILVLNEPFEHLIVDCVGPLPCSKSGCKYLLTVMCQNTLYPAAYPLRAITTKAVVKALSHFISVFGIPKVIQRDQGSNFSSHVWSCFEVVACPSKPVISLSCTESGGLGKIPSDSKVSPAGLLHRAG